LPRKSMRSHVAGNVATRNTMVSARNFLIICAL